MNGRSTGKIADVQERGGRLMMARSDLIELGLNVPRGVAPAADGLYAIASLPNVSARLDAATQTLYVTAADGALRANELQVAAPPAASVPLESATGLTLNYDMTGAVTGGRAYGSGLLDLRIFSPLGVASTDFLAFAGAPPGEPVADTTVRLDSTYVFSDFASQRRYWLGDFITGGLNWTRPVRLGGAQVTRDFSMRPDLVTFPAPIVAGSVAVPSTVDILVNGARLLSQQVDPGPFQVPQLPVITGAGEVQVTVTNALGQQVTTTAPFYASATLLAPGLHTYSLEAGAVRRNWGVASNDYGNFAAAGTYRRGVTDHLTIEAHAEGTKDQFMAAGGVVTDPLGLAVVNLGAAASSAEGDAGGELSVGIERVGRTFSFGGSGVFATAGFRDIAAMNGDPVPLRQITANATAYLGSPGSIGLAWIEVDRPPAPPPSPLTGRAASALPNGSVSPSTVGSGNGGLPLEPSQSARELTATYSVQLGRLFLYASGFHDFVGRGDGGTIGLTLPLGRRGSVTAGATAQDGAPLSGQIQAQQSAVDIGDWGYQAYLADGRGEHGFGQLQYKSPWALFTAGIDRSDGQATLRAEAQGALSLVDRNLFASNTITDAFAVVDTNGVGNVRVLYENRPQGVTSARGKLLVPSLRAWDANRISIDPADVPADAQVPYTERQVRPPARSGVVLRFRIRRTHGALLVLVDEARRPLPVGSVATLQATGDAVPVGYDGEAFVEELGKQNQLVVQLPNDGRCAVTFNYAPSLGEIPKIGPLTCRNL